MAPPTSATPLPAADLQEVLAETWHADTAVRKHLEALLCRPCVLAEPELLRSALLVLGAALPVAEALHALAAGRANQAPRPRVHAVA